MSVPLLRSSRFHSDYREVVLYLAEANPDVADRFCDAFEASLRFLAGCPEGGRLAGFPSAPGVRRWGIPEFRNYIIFYLPRPDGVLLIRLLHGARDLPRLPLGK